MTTMEPPPPPPVISTFKVPVEPGLLGALSGVWLLTWSTQMTWRRLPGRLALLLVLPFLIYITTQSLDNWSRHQASTSRIGPPPMNRLFRRLQENHPPLTDDQKTELTNIFRAEYSTAEKDLRDAQAIEDLSLRTDRANFAVDDCAQRILHRLPASLDDSQRTAFKNFVEGEQKRMHSVLVVRPQGWKRTTPFYLWLVDVYFFVVLPLTCVRECGALMRDELQADTLGFLVTRPVSRARLLVVKYLSHLAWLEMLLLVETLLIFATGALRQIPELGTLLPLFVAVQVLAVPAWCALGTFLGQVTNRYMAVALLYGGIVELGIGRIPTNINLLSLMRHLKTLLSHYNAFQTLYDWPGDNPWLSVLALVVAPILFLGVAAALFTFLEYLPASEMQK